MKLFSRKPEPRPDIEQRYTLPENEQQAVELFYRMIKAGATVNSKYIQVPWPDVPPIREKWVRHLNAEIRLSDGRIFVAVGSGMGLQCGNFNTDLETSEKMLRDFDIASGHYPVHVPRKMTITVPEFMEIFKAALRSTKITTKHMESMGEHTYSIEVIGPKIQMWISRSPKNYNAWLSTQPREWDITRDQFEELFAAWDGGQTMRNKMTAQDIMELL